MRLINVLDFSVDPTGEKLCSEQIQRALDACADRGGKLFFPAGRYLTGTLKIRDNTTVEFESGAVLLGSRNIEDYPAGTHCFVDACGANRGKALLISENAKNVSLIGEGCIDGQGDVFPDLAHRPMLLRFINCQNVSVRNLQLHNSGAWVQHYLNCRGVDIRGVKVHSYANANNDGLDIDSSEQVTVSDCRFACGDDAVTLKTTTPHPCRDIVVSNCTITSDCNAIKFGTESVGDCENLTVSNCSVYNTRLSGITIASVDGARVKNVRMSNLVMRNVGAAFFVRLGQRNYQSDIQSRDGAISNVFMHDISAFGCSPIGSSIQGIVENPIDSVFLRNIYLESSGGIAELPSGDLPENKNVYPEFNRWGNLPAYGIYARNIKRLSAQNVFCHSVNPDARPPVYLDDVEMNEDACQF